MKTEKLIPLLDYVLEQEKIWYNSRYENEDDRNFFNTVTNYAKFLSQPLKLSMFVPCDENQVPLEGKPLSPATDAEWDRWEKEKETYNKAKSNVLFEVTDEYLKNNIYDENGFFYALTTIESLVFDYNNYDLTLTENAVKTINQ